MKVTQRSSKNQEVRCVVCFDGPEGLVSCRGCSTLLHASCLIDVRGCPTLGCDEMDPYQARQIRCPHGTANAVDLSCMDCGAPRKEVERTRSQRSVEPRREPECCVHACGKDTLGDLRLLWGPDIEKACTCSPSTRLNRAVQRAEAGPKKEPTCKHRFNPDTHCCVYCGSTYLVNFVGSNRRPEEGYGINFAKEKIEADKRVRESRLRKQRFETFCIALVFVVGLSQLLHYVLTSWGYIPS